MRLPPLSSTATDLPGSTMRLATTDLSRRALAQATVSFLLASVRLPCGAFENRLPPDELELKYKTPRTPGPKPTDLGVRPGGGLKACIDGAPHCFSSTKDELVDDELSSGWLVQPFRYKDTLAEARAELQSVIAAYPPGQRNIDGGGFKVVTDKADADAAYIYVMFESRRKGFVDDMEFALSGGKCEVRTSSRLGYLDLGVNAKRYAYFSEQLAKKGWSTTPLTSKGHEEYFSLNRVTDRDMQQQ